MAPIYQVWLKSAAGARVAILDHFLALTYSRRVNGLGHYTLTLDGDDARVALFELDGQVEVWRADFANDIDWYKDGEFLHRKPRRYYTAAGESRFESSGRGYLDFLKRRIIAAAAGSADANKSGAAETVAKAYVTAQAGSGAVAARQITGLTVQTDGGHGNTVTLARSRRNLLEVLQEIAELGGGDFDLVGTGVTTFEFRWYDGQLGQDRTSGNADGNAPVTFASGFGNMGTPEYADDHLDEVTAVYVGGQGEGASRTVVERTDDTAIAASPWNRCEVFRDARQTDTTAGLNSTGDAVLEDGQAKESFSFDILQIDSCLYGLHYVLGDLVTGRFGSIERDKRIMEVTVSVRGGREQVENITLELADV